MSFPPNLPPSSPPLGFSSADELLDALPWGVLEFDAQRSIRRINQQAAKWCGAAPDTLLGQSLAEASLPSALGATLRQMLDTGAATPHEIWLPDSQQWISLRLGSAPAGQHWVFLEDITARQQAEADQQRNSQLLLDMEAVAHTGSYDADLSSGSFYFSDGMYRLFGEEPQSFLPTLTFIDARSHPDDVAMVRQVLDEAVRTRQPYTYRRRIRRADGQWRTLEAHGEVRTNAGGNAVQLRGLVQDITERVQAEEALHASRALLRATIDSSLDIVQVFEAVRDEHGEVVDFTWVLNNVAAERYYGDVIGQRLCQLNPGVVEEGVFATFRQVLETGVPDQSEHHYVHEQFNGWFYQSTVRLGDGVTTTTRDITERKQAHEEIVRLKDELTQQATDRYHALFYSMSQGFCLLEILFEEGGEEATDFRYLEVNPRFLEESGMPVGIEGKKVREVMPDLDAFWFDTYGQVARTGEAQRLERYVPEVSRWFDVHAFRVGAPEARQVAVLFSDITARKHIEEQLRQAAEAGTFRLQLADALGPLTSPVAIKQAVTQLTRQHFGADRCYYCEIEGGQVIIRHDATAEGLPSVAGTYSLAGFPLLQAAIETSRPFSVRDVREVEELAEPLRQRCVQLHVISCFNVPILKNGQLAGLLCLAQSTPRDWSTIDTALAVEVAGRAWSAVERARAEQALAASEQRLRALIANLPGAAAFVVGPDLRYQLAGGEALDAAGLVPADLLGRTVAEAMPPELVVPYEAHYQQALAGQSFSTEHLSHGRSFVSRGVPLPGPTGQPEAVLVVSYDITERKQAEAALRQAEEHYRQQLEQQVAERTQQLQESRDLLQSVFDTSLISLSVLYAVRDETGQVQDFRLGLVNKELARETGRTDLVGKLYAQEYPGIRQVGIFDLLLQALATGEPQGMEYFYASEGFNRWYVCQFVKLGDGIVATNLDITERKTAEQERLKNLRLLEQAEAVAGLGSWDYDLATGIMRWSEGMYQLLGLPLGQPVGPDVYQRLVVEEDQSRAEQLVHQLTAGKSAEATLRLRVGEEVKTVRLKAVVLRDETGRPERVLGVDLDISELQRLEADNLRLRLGQQQALFEAVQAAQEAERKRMAESLHNSIGQILYATKLRLDRLHVPILGTHPTLVTARREADQLLSEAIRQTRALSHELVPMVLQEFGLEAALQDISRKMSTPQRRLRSHVLLDPAAAPLPPSLQMALYRMAQELAQNIAKHAHGATEASLELETTPGWVLLRAEDNGAGFSSVAPSGLGLGLRSIRDRVTLLGGRLENGSAPSGGAYVRIRIPLPSSTFPSL